MPVRRYRQGSSRIGGGIGSHNGDGRWLREFVGKNCFGHVAPREYIIRTLSFRGGAAPFGFKGAGFSSRRNPLRRYGRGDIHFVTFSCYRRRPFLGTLRARDRFVKILDEVRLRHQFQILEEGASATTPHVDREATQKGGEDRRRFSKYSYPSRTRSK